MWSNREEPNIDIEILEKKYNAEINIPFRLVDHVLLVRILFRLVFSFLWFLNSFFLDYYLVPQSINFPLGSGNIIPPHLRRR